MRHPFPVQSRSAEAKGRTTIFAVNRKCLVPKLTHEFGHILSIYPTIVAVTGRRLICCAKAAQVWCDDAKVWREVRQNTVPVIVSFRCAVEEKEWWSRACGYVVHA